MLIMLDLNRIVIRNITQAIQGCCGRRWQTDGAGGCVEDDLMSCQKFVISNCNFLAGGIQR